MLEELCAYLHNYFERHPTTRERKVYAGEYTITGGGLDLPFLIDGQRFRIRGSALNDGVYTYGAPIRDADGADYANLTDETFTGEVWAMYPPKAIIEAAVQAGTWVEKYAAQYTSPFTSESVPNYSYTKAAADASDGMPAGTWYGVPKNVLAPYRKVSE